MSIEVETLPKTYAELHALAVSLLASLEAQEQQTTEHRQTIERQAADLNAKSATIDQLLFELARLKRWRFGKSSEQLNPNQLTLWQTELEEDIAEVEAKVEALEVDEAVHRTKRQPRRLRLPAHLPRQDHHYELDTECCTGCGHPLTRFGEEASEQLDIIPPQFFVQRHIRGKYACRCCETVVTAPMPAQAIEKGLPAPGLVAHVLVSKYAYHLPLHRQEIIFANQGVSIPRSTQAGWVGQSGVSLEPVVAAMRRAILTESYLQADETPVPVLAPGNGKTKTGYLWVYRTGPWSDIQAVVFDYAETRGQQWPTAFLEGFSGILQVDGYSGYNQVLSRQDVLEAGCAAHARRKFHDVFKATKSPTAHAALRWIAKLYVIEADIKDLSPEDRMTQRRQRAGPLLDAFKTWLEDTMHQLPSRSSLAAACGYTLGRWRALRVYLDHGHVNIDNNPVERTIRGAALGRRNYLFAGSDNGGDRAALIYSLIESCKLNNIEPFAYLKDVLTRLPTLPPTRLDELLPWNWKAASPQVIVP